MDTSPVIEFDIIEHYRNLKWDDLNRYQKELFNSLKYYPHNWNKSSITKFSDFSYKLKVVIEPIQECIVVLLSQNQFLVHT